MKPSDPLLLADVPLRFGMWPAVKVDFSENLAIPGLPQIHQTVGKPSLVKHSRPSDLKSASNVSLPIAWITGSNLTYSCFVTCKKIFKYDFRNGLAPSFTARLGLDVHAHMKCH